MAWGGLNPALTSWRNGINALFPNRDTTTDGGYADAVHGSDSQHQPDSDGSVDAFDMDVNLCRSGTSTGSSAEKTLIEALKRDFQADPRAHLWIHDRQIANHEIENWKRRSYGGSSPHTEHVHWESHGQNEADGSPWDFTHTRAAMADLGMGDEDMKMEEYFESVGKAVRGESSATSQDRRNRENFTDAMQFAYGLAYTAQSGATVPAGRDEAVVAGLAEVNAKLEQLIELLTPPAEPA